MATVNQFLELSRTNKVPWHCVWLRWFVLLLAVTIVWATPWLLAGWASMLVNCAAIFLALKHFVWLAAGTATRQATRGERTAFYLLWPGFDAEAFLRQRDAAVSAPAVQEWLAAGVKTAIAVGLLWAVLPRFEHVNTTLIGIAGMLGGVLLIHCGLFHFVAIAWQMVGRPVTPIMNAPLAATSLVDFWSRRWNLAFRDAAALVLFRPLARRFNPLAATMATFLFSGLWHEAAISLTARGGYGLPTLYFLIQGLGMTIERRWQRRTTGAPRPWFVRATTATIVVLPLPLLFHRPFAERVIIPLLHVLGVF